MPTISGEVIIELHTNKGNKTFRFGAAGTIVGNEITGIGTTNGTYGVKLNQNYWGLVTGNQIYNVQYGITLGSTNHYNQITANHVGTCNYGINGPSAGNLIAGNRIWSCTAYGIVANGSGDDGLISGNKLIGNATGIYLGASLDSWLISGNHVETGATGLSIISGATKILVQGNLFTGQTTAALSDAAAATSGCEFTGNHGIPNYKSVAQVATAVGITLDATHNYKTVVVTADAQTITLPATAANLRYRIVNGVKDAGALLTVDPAAADRILKLGAAAMADGEAYLNTKATARCGDYVELQGDGADGWTVVDQVGTWAEETP
mgnify:FL=1